MDSGHLRNLIAAAAIGSKHRLDLVREGKMIQVDLTVQEAPRERAKKAQAAGDTTSGAHLLWGVVLEDETPPVDRKVDLPDSSGVVETDIEEGSSARILWCEMWRPPRGNKSTGDSEFFHVSAPRRPCEIQRSRSAPRKPKGNYSLHPRRGENNKTSSETPIETRCARADILRNTNQIIVPSQSEESRSIPRLCGSTPPL